MVTLTPILSILAGFVLLLSGRRIFWLAAGLAAYLFIYPLLLNWLEPGLTGMIIAGVVGLLLAFLAIRFVRLVGGLIGALAGAAAFPSLLGLLGIHWAWWIMALAGAVIGLILVSLAFDWGLILVTSWMGANVVATTLPELLKLSGPAVPLLFIVLLGIGIAAQAGMLKGAARPASRARSR
jgi:hypothetical protein